MSELDQENTKTQKTEIEYKSQMKKIKKKAKGK